MANTQLIRASNSYHPLGALLFTNTTWANTIKIINEVGVPAVPFLEGNTQWVYNYTTGAVQAAPAITPAFLAALQVEVPKYIEFWETSFGPEYQSIGYKVSLMC